MLSLLLLTQSTYLLPSSQPTALPSSIRDSSSGNRIGKQTDRPDRLMRLPSSRKKESKTTRQEEVTYGRSKLRRKKKGKNQTTKLFRAQGRSRAQVIQFRRLPSKRIQKRKEEANELSNETNNR